SRAVEHARLAMAQSYAARMTPALQRDVRCVTEAGDPKREPGWSPFRPDRTGRARGVVIPASGVSPRAGTQDPRLHTGIIHSPWVPDIALARNSGMTVTLADRKVLYRRPPRSRSRWRHHSADPTGSLEKSYSIWRGTLTRRALARSTTS